MAKFASSGQAKRLMADKEDWIERLARAGYLAKGAVYVLVGALSLQAAFSAGESAEGSKGALLTLLRQPMGRAMLGVVALGLVGYALWKLVEAGVDPENQGGDAVGMTKRAGYTISGVVHGALAWQAGRMALWGSGDEGGGIGAQHWTEMVMGQPLGRWVIAGVGVGIIAFGLYEVYRAVNRDLARHLDLTSLKGDTRPWVVRLGRFGLMARGVVFGVIGYFLIDAALTYDPRGARGVGGVLRTLEQQPYGAWLLGVVAAGLIGYGLFGLAKGMYRRLSPG